MNERPYVVMVLKHKGNDVARAFATRKQANDYKTVQEMSPNTKSAAVSCSRQSSQSSLNFLDDHCR